MKYARILFFREAQDRAENIAKIKEHAFNLEGQEKQLVELKEQIQAAKGPGVPQSHSEADLRRTGSGEGGSLEVEVADGD